MKVRDIPVPILYIKIGEESHGTWRRKARESCLVFEADLENCSPA
ncbi:hypothetical protein [Microbulbifer variabilis]|nr:hypothetical protein [Microbulbifer variabilis]